MSGSLTTKQVIRMASTLERTINRHASQRTSHGSERHATPALVDSRARILKSIEPFVETQLVLLKPVEECWQPSDMLPHLTTAAWAEGIQQLRMYAQGLSDELLVVLVGDMVTEEALPAYQTMFNRHDGLSDETGADDNPWAQWSRGWTAEEARHGALLNTYLYLSGRVDMRAVDATIQRLIRNGFDPLTDNDPYHGLIYTAFQERATKISHSNTARLATQSGDQVLSRMCNMIAGDEARHEEAYKRFVGQIVAVDPVGAVLAIAQMMKTKIVMPGERMADGGGTGLFERFSVVAQRIGVYTARDYAQIIEHLVDYWRIPRLTGFTGEAAEAQAYLCGLADRYRRLAERMERQATVKARRSFSWIFGREL